MKASIRKRKKKKGKEYVRYRGCKRRVKRQRCCVLCIVKMVARQRETSVTCLVMSLISDEYVGVLLSLNAPRFLCFNVLAFIIFR